METRDGDETSATNMGDFVCVHNLWGCGSETYLLEVCPMLNFQVEKTPERAVLSLVCYARQVFSSYAFLLVP